MMQKKICKTPKPKVISFRDLQILYRYIYILNLDGSLQCIIRSCQMNGTYMLTLLCYHFLLADYADGVHQVLRL